VEKATLLIGSDRHLSYFPNHPGQKLVLGDFTQAIAAIRQQLTNSGYIVVLVTGDPLFFGLGRLLLTQLPPDQLTFHPHLSAVALALMPLRFLGKMRELLALMGALWMN
jgi:precorrin-6Y C5,15-methyltransferase (decarboxylating)